MMILPSMFNRSAKTLSSHGYVRCSAWVLAVILSASSNFASAQPADFTPFEVEYEVGNNMISAGSATLALTKQGGEWVYSLKTTPTGVFKLTGKGKIQEISVFSVASNTDKLQLQPQKYTYRQDDEANRSVDAKFDLSRNQLTYKKRGEEFTESFTDPVLDRLSVTLTVIDQLKRNNFKEAKLPVFDNGKVKTMIFANEGTETVETRMGPLKTVRVRSKALGGATRHTTTWFAPELDFVPVKMEQYKRDKLVARLTLIKLANRITDAGGAPAFKEGVEIGQ